jgi:integrase
MGVVTGRAGRRDFDYLRALPSGRYQASYLGPYGLRRFAPATFSTRADAQAWLAVKQAELLRGEWTDPDLARVPLGAYAARWIAEHRLSPRTRDLYEGLFRLHVEPYLGPKAIGSITPETVRAWRARLRADGRSDPTVAKAYRLLRAILNTAVDDGRLLRNPCRIKGADRETPTERPVASVPQVFALADAVGPHYRAVVLTAALASLRWGELVGLRRHDIDLEQGLIHVRRSMSERGGTLEVVQPKSGSARTVALPAILVDILRDHLERVGPGPESPVFTGERGGTPRRGNWRDIVGWPEAVNAAGLPAGFHFHDLRHTGNHLAAQTGASTRELMQRMGHSTVRAAMIHQHATDARSRLLADRLDELVRTQREACS